MRDDNLIENAELEQWERGDPGDMLWRDIAVRLMRSERRWRHGEAMRQQAHAADCRAVGVERDKLRAREVELDALIDRDAEIGRRERKLAAQLNAAPGLPDAVRRLRESTTSSAAVRGTSMSEWLEDIRLYGIYPAELFLIIEWLRTAVIGPKAVGIEWVHVGERNPPPDRWVLVYWRHPISNPVTQTCFGIARRSELMVWRDDSGQFSITPTYWAELPRGPVAVDGEGDRGPVNRSEGEGTA